MKGSQQDCREGLIVELTDKKGINGFGDAAPFPGLHNESLDDIITEIKSIVTQIVSCEFDLHQDIFSNLNQLPKSSPSLQFALEGAVVDWIAKARGIIPTKLISSNPENTILLNALLTGSFEEVLIQAEKLKSKKYKAIKLKVATRPLEEDIELVLRLNEMFEGKISIRLDANRGWSDNQAIEFGQAVNKANIEYIEEPLNDVTHLLDFYQSTGIFYALDESLAGKEFNLIPGKEGLRALILKPSLLGSVSQIKEWINVAEEFKAYTVFSSTFESGVGLRAISHLAGALAKKDVAHGLDTFNWLKEDVTIPAFTTQASFIGLTNQEFSLNNKNLKNIYEYNF